jgi:predicted Fe-Mo cluster-binding NifX family protein
MVVAVAVTPEGTVGGGWGRASRVALASVEDGAISAWQEVEVGWDRLHDEGGEGTHHARIARFLIDHHVQRVICGHMGPGMQRMLARMGIDAVVGESGPARQAVARHAHECRRPSVGAGGGVGRRWPTAPEFAQQLAEAVNPPVGIGGKASP